jgi:NADH-quinone oxidoreductase subunit D
MTDDHKVAPPKRRQMKTNMEELIHHFKLFTEGFHVPRGRSLCRGGASQGRVRHLPGVRRGQQTLPAEDPRARALPTWQALDEMTRGHMIADAVAIIGTMDIVFGEVDR